jgi:ketosteroid isomerase-like protein
MSEENVEIVRRALDAVGRGEAEELLSYTDPEVVLSSAVVGRAEGRTYRGHDGVQSWLDDANESFEHFSFNPTELRDLGDRFLALGQFEARGRRSGVELDSLRGGWIFSLRGGEIVKLEGHLALADALEAAGLTE